MIVEVALISEVPAKGATSRLVAKVIDSHDLGLYDLRVAFLAR